MPAEVRPSRREPLRVPLLVLPDAGVGTVTGMFDTLASFPLLGTFDPAVPAEAPFAVELVAATRDPQPTASGIALPVHRSIADPGHTDIALVPSLVVLNGSWVPGRYPELRRVAAARAP